MDDKEQPEGVEVKEKALTTTQEHAARLIADGFTQAAAASHPTINVSKVTMNRWCGLPVFRAKVDEFSGLASAEAEEILRQGLVDAAKTIADMAAGRLERKVWKDNGAETTEAVAPEELNPRLRAALYILDRILKKTKMPPVKPTSNKLLPSTNDPEEPGEDSEIEFAIKRAQDKPTK